MVDPDLLPGFRQRRQGARLPRRAARGKPGVRDVVEGVARLEQGRCRRSRQRSGDRARRGLVRPISPAGPHRHRRVGWPILVSRYERPEKPTHRHPRARAGGCAGRDLQRDGAVRGRRERHAGLSARSRAGTSAWSGWIAADTTFRSTPPSRGCFSSAVALARRQPDRRGAEWLAGESDLGEAAPHRSLQPHFARAAGRRPTGLDPGWPLRSPFSPPGTTTGGPGSGGPTAATAPG